MGKLLFTLTGLICVLGLLLGLWIYSLYEPNLSSLPTGDYLFTSISPGENYRVNFYVANGGATVDYAVRGELVWEAGKKNIYWDYHQSQADAFWLDENRISINGTVLDVTKDVYDFRRHIKKDEPRE